MSFTGYDGSGDQQGLFENQPVEKVRGKIFGQAQNKYCWIGTSGFSYDDWVGRVYPQQLKRKQWFDYYCDMFNALELNMSYYRLPSKKVIQSFVNRAPKGFFLSIKAHQSMTHHEQTDYVPAFNELLRQIGEHGMYSLLLLQF